MKKTILIAALTLMSTTAFASKARMTALGNAAHLGDVQTIFANPSDFTDLKDLATFEFGPSAPAGATPYGNAAPSTGVVKAEGGFVKSAGDAKWGFYLGHQDMFTNWSRSKTGAGFLAQENPFDVFYGSGSGDMKWAASLSYSNSERKGATTAAQKQNAMGLRAGAKTADWDVDALIGLGAKATGTGTVADDSVEAGSSLGVNGGINRDSMYWFASYGMDASKYKVAATSAETKYDVSAMEIGGVDRAKIDGGEFFYGASYKSAMVKIGTAAGDTKVTNTTLPVVVGLETETSSWLTVRGSITQDILISSSKTETATPPATENINANNTTVAAGVGIKWGKVTIDATAAAASNATGMIGTDGNNFLANGSLTYNF